jgi:geranylgeranyl diphosphate synthase, type II
MLTEFLERVRTAVDADLALRLRHPGRLWEAMRYAVLGGGKRLRPALVSAASIACGGSIETSLPAASAVEMLHAYTLVHDDLPAMDDDDLRRGKPTVHIAFDEATAVLAGDALLTEAFATLAELSHAADAVRTLAARSGADQLLGGQVADLAGPPADFEALEAIHRGKTGALFAAATELGGIANRADGPTRAILAEIGMLLGVAFQHADDVDDGDHLDHADRARARVTELVGKARALLPHFGERGSALSAMADWVQSLV